MEEVEDFEEVDLVTDTDGDGIPDYFEINGWKTTSGNTFHTDPENADTDDDGLPDGLESGPWRLDENGERVYELFTDPTNSDTDGDGIGDGDEYFMDMDPNSLDTDGDGLPDNVELEFGSDPTHPNIDGDNYTDAEEYARKSDPLVYDLTPEESMQALKAGGLYGDCHDCARRAGINDSQIESIEYLTGTSEAAFWLLETCETVG